MSNDDAVRAAKDTQQAASDTKDAARATQDAAQKTEDALDVPQERQDAAQDAQDTIDEQKANKAQDRIEALEQSVRRKEFFFRLILIAMAVFVFLSILVIGYLVATVREVQDEGSPIQKTLLELTKDNKRYGERLVDCTTPGGECYKQGQKSQAGALDIINEATIYAIACGNRHPAGGVGVIQRCVKDLYEKNNE